VQRGIASWYGKKFHGRRTSSGETYDMYGMTAAHTQLPLPTYVQVTNLKNGKQVVLRVNDRGPFHGNRVIDLSYSAAHKLGIVQEGTGLVEVRAIDPRNYQLVHNSELNNNRDINMSRGAKSKFTTATQPQLIYEETQELALKVEGNQAVYVDEDSGITEQDATTVSDTGPQVFVQVGAFGEYENANQLKNRLKGLNLGEVIISSVIINSKQLHRVRIGPLSTVQSADDAVIELNTMGLSGHRVVIE
jgi:rare lipoprotein A